MSRIYLSPPHMGDDEFRFVKEAFDTNWMSTVGPHLGAFEAEMSAYLSGTLNDEVHAVALASGTAAIHLGMKLYGVGPGDIVLCPSLTFAASINPAVYQGARPYFVDSERQSWNLCPESLAAALDDLKKRGERAKAVVAVHLFGQTANMTRINEVCAAHDVPIFEDAAEALGADYEGHRAGTLSPLAALSFNGNKIITTTGGGMLLAKNKAHADRARHWSTQAREPGIAYEHKELGYNYRLSNVLAGIGRGQLRVLEDRVAQRRHIRSRYVEAFAALELGGLTAMPEAPWGKHTHWLSVFTVNPAVHGVDSNQLIAALTEADIEARPVWKPMHLQPIFAGAKMFGGAVAEDLFATGICLPSGSSLTEVDQNRIIDVIAKTLRR